MSPNTPPDPRLTKKPLSPDWVAFTALTLLATLVALLLSAPFAAPARLALDRLFGFNTQQAMWYLTRAAGIMAYLLLWLSTVWGLAIPSKIFTDVLNGEFAFDFHQFISLLSLGFLALHVFVLTADRYLPYSLAQVLIPFYSPYRPVWVGIGIIATYLMLLVTVTFYIRKRIGMKAFRYIHYSSLLAYVGGLFHSIFSGTDSSLPAVMLMYVITFLVVVFLVVYWLVVVRMQRKKETGTTGGSALAAGLRTRPNLGRPANPSSYAGMRNPAPVRADVDRRPKPE